MDNISKNSLTQMFKGYMDYSEDEYREIWDSGLIIVDANILLNFYRYSEDTRKEVFKALSQLKNRIWIPYFVAKEYFSNKKKVMTESYNEYTNLSNSIIQELENAKNDVKSKKNSQLKCKNNIINILEESKQKICSLLNNEKEEKNPHHQEKAIENELLSLFNDSVGKPFPDDVMEKIKKEGFRRIEMQIPPGYKDQGKDENGDYYIFYSLIEKAKECNKSIIFVTDDVKEDWFNLVNGEKKGGRYELLNEFYNETGKLLLMYTSDGFIKAYGENITKETVNKEIVDELITTRTINKNNRNYNLFNEYSIINNIRDSISNDSQEIEYHLDDLMYLIRKQDIPKDQKDKYLSYIYDYKQKKKLNQKFDKEELLTLFNSIIKMYSISDYILHYTNGHKKLYRQTIQKFHNINEKAELLTCYSELIEIIKNHLVFLEMSPTNESHKLQLELSHMINLLENIIEKNDFSSSTKNTIIDTLKDIIDG